MKTLYALLLFLSTSIVLAETTELDTFDQINDWTVVTSESADLEIAQDGGHEGMAMRLDFDFNEGGGYVIAQKQFHVPIELPTNYAFSFNIRGEAPSNNLEFKLLDQTGKNVWRKNFRNHNFTKEWQKLRVKKRHIDFAWGSNGGSDLKNVYFLEFAISAGTGGKGSVWIDGLTLENRKHVSVCKPPRSSDFVRASTTANGHEPYSVFDTNPNKQWKSGSIAEGQWFNIDFQEVCEYGGLVIEWDDADYAEAFEIQISNTGKDWQRVHSVDSSNGQKSYIYLPEMESRYLRLDLQRSSRGNGYGIKDILVKPHHFSSSINSFFEAIAKDAELGNYPKHLRAEQSYWTVIGVAGDHKEALINEQGLIEVDKESFSIEPFLHVEGRAIKWKDAVVDQELEEEYLPIPTVNWVHEGVKLKITALASGEPGSSSLYIRYRVENETDQPKKGSLFLALRPFQVNPAWQSLNTSGGAAKIKEIQFENNHTFVNQEKVVTSLTKVDDFGSVKFSQGNIVDYISRAKLPSLTHVIDTFEYASGAMEYKFELAQYGSKDIYLVIPFHGSQPVVEAGLQVKQAERLWINAFESTKRYWTSKLNHVDIQLPTSEKKLINTLRTTLAYVLINQDGPAIQPGSRAYERSWIRDGSLTSAALLQTGQTEEVRDFIKWYAKFQLENGKIPCCVDSRGSDPVPEHDSNGQWIYLVMEYYRYTRDIGFLNAMWPHVEKAVMYIDSLRRQRMTEEYQSPKNLVYYGLVPESISHEGYSSNPAHSYWDNFFILRGLKDATNMAQILGEEETATKYSNTTNAYRDDLYASVERSMKLHKINYIPGAAELGDFDATATTISIDPGGEMLRLPQPALSQTFEKYYDDVFQQRLGSSDKHSDVKNGWEAYTPYEIRLVGTNIRLGDKRRAHELLDFFFQHQYPSAWNHWGEIVWSNPKNPKFIGDMPHTWVGSDYIRSVRSMFVYERESDQSLVIGAGILEDWLTSEEGVSLKRLPTYYGPLNYSLQKTNGETVRYRISGDLSMPPGKIIIRSPRKEYVTSVTVNGESIQSFTSSEAVINKFPAEVLLHYGPNVRAEVSVNRGAN